MARRDRAILLVDMAMETVLHANEAGRRAFGLAGGDRIPGLLARQLGSGTRRLAQGEAVRLVLRAPAAAVPIAARVERVRSTCGDAVLLASEAVAESPREDAARLLADLDLGKADAALLGADGVLAGSAPVADDVAAAARAMIEAGTETACLSRDGLGVQLFLVADGIVLAETGAGPVPAEAPTASASGGDSFGDDEDPIENAPAPGRGPMNIAAIVGRWNSRQTAPLQAVNRDGESEGEILRAAAVPTLLRSLWGAPPDTDAARSPVETSASVEVPAALADAAEPPDRGPETPQPIDGEHPTIVPDITEEEAADLDRPLTPDDERPEGGDLLSAPEEFGPPPRPEPQDNETAAEPAEPEPPPFAAALEGAPVRFVWRIDGEGRFRSLSPDFGDVVGPRAADVVGRSFGEVAGAFGLDETGEIRRLLERRDTWSGRTVLWPVEGTARRVPIDLAALPVYGRDRDFDGFRGFGILRRADAVEDPDALGLALPSFRDEAAAPAADASDTLSEADEPSTAVSCDVLKSVESELPGVAFGRRQSPPPSSLPADETLPTVIRFSERRRMSDTMLSAAEEAAFREIGAKLGHGASEAKTPGALRFEDTSAGTAQTAPKTQSAAPAEEPADIAAMLAALPLPILVQGQGGTVFANAPLLDVSGHADLAAFNDWGGLDSLFPEAGGDTRTGLMPVRRADGTSRAMRVHMQRIPFAGRSSLLMSFEPLEAAQAEKSAAVPQAPAPASFGEAELRRELGELKAVLDIAADGVVLFDPDGIVRAVNGSAQALFGFSEEEFAGRPVAALFAHESQKAVLDYIETLKDKGLAGVLNDGREVIGRVAQGGFVPLFVTLGRLSEARGWCLVIRDMSHWKRIEEELVNARRAAEAASLHKSRFLANISHELRTPMNAIIGFADVMASECFGPIGNERYIEYLGDIKRSGHHVLDLVNDLLDISKIEAGKMELTFESVSLNEILAEVVSVMQPQANRERVIVRSNLPPSVPPVVADRRTIRQIALNLLSNSVRFTPAGGQIIASTTYTAEGDVLMRVRDSGIGMTEREIEIALAPFQQVHQPDMERGKGTGLGLPLTKAMAEANRASFSIRSTPGEGTLVEIGFSAQRVLAD